MCFVCDGIAEPCGWQLAKAAETYFAGWEEDDKCGMCDADFDEFVTELGLERKKTCSIGCQAGLSALVSEAGLSASAEVRQRAVGRNVAAEPGTTSPHSKIRLAIEFS